VTRYARAGLPVSILQPSVVYGPFGTTWTSDILDRLTTGNAILVDGGRANCNAVYVDDVVTAAFLAATSSEAVGETFLISSDDKVTWADFYGRFEDMLGRTATVSMSEDEALRYWRRSSRRPALWSQLPRLARRADVLSEILNTREGNLALRLARRVLPSKIRKTILTRPGPPHSMSGSRDRYIHPLNPHAVRFVSRSQQVAIDKAATFLGYRPAFSLERGMHLTRLWAEWAGLLPAE
jgi:nucleoside-diphosphate-sugar epimerase